LTKAEKKKEKEKEKEKKKKNKNKNKNSRRCSKEVKKHKYTISVSKKVSLSRVLLLWRIVSRRRVANLSPQTFIVQGKLSHLDKKKKTEEKKANQ